MAVTLGSGKYEFEPVDGWAKMPAGWKLMDAPGVCVDSKDNVYVFTRGTHPLMVFDKSGNVIDTWGDDIFTRAHGLTMSPDGKTIWCTDDGDHTVRHCTLDGKVLLTIGTPGKPAPLYSGQPFNRPTKVAFSPTGELYISDGYGNARVHKYTPEGKYLFSWGGPGMGPGEFNVVHDIVTDAEGFVYVADRESHRIQVFDGKGKLQAVWLNVHRPCGLTMDRANKVLYVGELGPVISANENGVNIGPRLSVLDLKGNVLARIGEKRKGDGLDQFYAPHATAMDSRGDIYVGEVTWTHLGKPDKEFRCFRKLARKK